MYTRFNRIHIYKLLNEAEYDAKHYAECYRQRRITASVISVILYILRQSNSIIILLFIQNISKFLTSLPPVDVL